MEFKEEFITENKLTEEQVTALTSATNDNEATLKKEWDGMANTNAEKILGGAASKIAEKTNVARNEGEKIGDYIARAQITSFSTRSTEIDTLKAEYEEKIKNAGSDEAVKAELVEFKNKFSELQKKEASFDELIGSGIQDKYETQTKDYNRLNLEVSFNSVKPNFPDTVNTYEANAKWDDFKSEILSKYDIVLVEGEAIAIDKENDHKRPTLKELVGKNTEIATLLEGRQQKGPNGKPTEMGKIEGIPFDVPTTAKTDTKARAQAIRDYLSKENISNTDSEYSTKFKEYNDKIMKQQTA